MAKHPLLEPGVKFQYMDPVYQQTKRNPDNYPELWAKAEKTVVKKKAVAKKKAVVKKKVLAKKKAVAKMPSQTVAKKSCSKCVYRAKNSVTISHKQARMVNDLIFHLLNNVGGGENLLYDSGLTQRLEEPASVTHKMVAMLERPQARHIWAKTASKINEQLPKVDNV